MSGSTFNPFIWYLPFPYSLEETRVTGLDNFVVTTRVCVVIAARLWFKSIIMSLQLLLAIRCMRTLKNRTSSCLLLVSLYPNSFHCTISRQATRRRPSKLSGEWLCRRPTKNLTQLTTQVPDQTQFHRRMTLTAPIKNNLEKRHSYT